MSKQNKTIDRIQAVWNKLGGEDGVDALLRGDTKVVLVKPELHNFPVWKKITIGNHDSLDNLIKSVGKDNHSFLLKNIYFISDIEVEISLCVATVSEITGKSCAYKDEIYESIISKGYDTCHEEVIPQLFLQYQDQPNCDTVYISTREINDHQGGLVLFNIENSDNRRSIRETYSGTCFKGSDKFVFMSRK